MNKSKLILFKMLKRWQLYLLLVIPLVYIIVFCYVPMVGAQIALKDFDLRYGLFGSNWVGFKHFSIFFNSYQFSRVISNTLSISFYSLVIKFFIPIIFALLLNALPFHRFTHIVQTVTYIPHFISTVVMVGIVMQMLDSRIGLYGIAYRSLYNQSAPDLFGKADAFPHIYVWSGIWQSLGWDTIIYFAALSGNDIALHEAAQIDGASRFQRLIHIDLPCILPTATILLILSTGSVLNVGFEKVYLLQNNLNIQKSEVISTYVYKVGLVTGGGDFSYATAIGLFNSIVNFTLLTVVNKVCGRLGGSSLW